jgi:hypothetical protein
MWDVNEKRNERNGRRRGMRFLNLVIYGTQNYGPYIYIYILEILYRK